MEKTFVILKPDAVNRGILGKITDRLESKGLKLAACKMMQLDDAILEKHYAHLADKPFFAGIKKFMKSSPVLAMAWEGKDAVAVVRALCGVTNSRNAAPGTIRGDFAMSIQCNIIHASDSIETAQKEIPMYFKPEELFNYQKCDLEFAYSPDERT